MSGDEARMRARELLNAEELNPKGNWTNLYDAILLVGGSRFQWGYASWLLVVTDGEDTSSITNWQCVQNLFERETINLMVVGVGPGCEEMRKMCSEVAKLGRESIYIQAEGSADMKEACEGLKRCLFNDLGSKIEFAERSRHGMRKAMDMLMERLEISERVEMDFNEEQKLLQDQKHSIEQDLKRAWQQIVEKVDWVSSGPDQKVLKHLVETYREAYDMAQMNKASITNLQLGAVMWKQWFTTLVCLLKTVRKTGNLGSMHRRLQSLSNLKNGDFHVMSLWMDGALSQDGGFALKTEALKSKLFEGWQLLTKGVVMRPLGAEASGALARCNELEPALELLKNDTKFEKGIESMMQNMEKEEEAQETDAKIAKTFQGVVDILKSNSEGTNFDDLKEVEELLWPG